MSGAAKIAIVHPGDRRQSAATGNPRFSKLMEEFSRLGVAAEPALYHDEVAEEVREQLRSVDAALVWVDPIEGGHDRSVLDAMLRDVAASGVFVSAHPDVILAMGTKEVLFQTREMGWSSHDIYLYRSVDELRRQLPEHLADGSSRVLKQNRGNGGNGVWRVELTEGGAAQASDPAVRVLHALRGSREQMMPLSAFIAACEQAYLDGPGQMIDQPFLSPVPGGMIRCYMTHNEVVGFGHQYVTALSGPEPPAPSPRLYYPPSQIEFQSLRTKMETEWIPQLQRLLHVATEALPVIWDADFLLGPKGPAGEDTYVLCEINVSCVTPFPDSALPRIAEATLRRLRQ